MRSAKQAAATALVCGLFVGSLVGCAPEPGVNDVDDTDSGIVSPDPAEKQEPEGGSWPEENPPEVFEKKQDIPDDFPETFVVPVDAVVDDAGTRGYGVWFLVLRAEDEAAANALWDAIVTDSGFVVSDESETTEGGRAATLTSDALAVQALTMPDADGSVLLSYDITAIAG